MQMRAALALAGRDLDQAQRDAAGAGLAGHDLERGTAGQAEFFGIGQFQHARHHFTCRRRFTSAVPPCTASSAVKMSVASMTIASTMSASIFWPFSAVACSGLPNQPVGAI